MSDKGASTDTPLTPLSTTVQTSKPDSRAVAGSSTTSNTKSKKYASKIAPPRTSTLPLKKTKVAAAADASATITTPTAATTTSSPSENSVTSKPKRIPDSRNSNPLQATTGNAASKKATNIPFKAATKIIENAGRSASPTKSVSSAESASIARTAGGAPHDMIAKPASTSHQTSKIPSRKNKKKKNRTPNTASATNANIATSTDGSPHTAIDVASVPSSSSTTSTDRSPGTGAVEKLATTTPLAPGSTKKTPQTPGSDTIIAQTPGSDTKTPQTPGSDAKLQQHKVSAPSPISSMPLVSPASSQMASPPPSMTETEMNGELDQASLHAGELGYEGALESLARKLSAASHLPVEAPCAPLSPQRQSPEFERASLQYRNAESTDHDVALAEMSRRLQPGGFKSVGDEDEPSLKDKFTALQNERVELHAQLDSARSDAKTAYEEMEVLKDTLKKAQEEKLGLCQENKNAMAALKDLESSIVSLETSSNEVKRENQQLAAELAKQQEKLKELSTENTNIDNEWKQAATLGKAVEEQLKKAVEEKDVVEKELKKAVAEKAAIQDELEKASAEKAAIKAAMSSKVAEKEAKDTTLISELALANERAEKAAGELKLANCRADEAGTELARAIARADALAKEKEKLVAELAQANMRLEKAADSAVAGLTLANKKSKDVEGQLAEAKAVAEELAYARKKAAKELEQATNALKKLAQEKYAVEQERNKAKANLADMRSSRDSIKTSLADSKSRNLELMSLVDTLQKQLSEVQSALELSQFQLEVSEIRTRHPESSTLPPESAPDYNQLAEHIKVLVRERDTARNALTAVQEEMEKRFALATQQAEQSKLQADSLARSSNETEAELNLANKRAEQMSLARDKAITEAESLSADKVELEAEIHSLEQEIFESCANVEKLQSALQKSDEARKEQQGELETLKLVLDGANTRIKELEKALEETLAVLKLDLDSANAEITLLREESETLRERLQTTQSQKEKLAKESDSLLSASESKAANLQVSMDEMKEKENATAKERDSLKVELDTARQQLRELSSERENVSKQLNGALTELRTEIEKLSSEKISWTHERDSMESEITLLRDKASNADRESLKDRSRSLPGLEDFDEAAEEQSIPGLGSFDEDKPKSGKWFLWTLVTILLLAPAALFFGSQSRADFPAASTIHAYEKSSLNPPQPMPESGATDTNHDVDDNDVIDLCVEEIGLYAEESIAEIDVGCLENTEDWPSDDSPRPSDIKDSSATEIDVGRLVNTEDGPSDDVPPRPTDIQYSSMAEIDAGSLENTEDGPCDDSPQPTAIEDLSLTENDVASLENTEDGPRDDSPQPTAIEDPSLTENDVASLENTEDGPRDDPFQSTAIEDPSLADPPQPTLIDDEAPVDEQMEQQRTWAHARNRIFAPRGSLRSHLNAASRRVRLRNNDVSDNKKDMVEPPAPVGVEMVLSKMQEPIAGVSEPKTIEQEPMTGQSGPETVNNDEIETVEEKAIADSTPDSKLSYGSEWEWIAQQIRENPDPSN